MPVWELTDDFCSTVVIDDKGFLPSCHGGPPVPSHLLALLSNWVLPHSATGTLSSFLVLVICPSPVLPSPSSCPSTFSALHAPSLSLLLLGSVPISHTSLLIASMEPKELGIYSAWDTIWGKTFLTDNP